MFFVMVIIFTAEIDEHINNEIMRYLCPLQSACAPPVGGTYAGAADKCGINFYKNNNKNKVITQL